MATHEVTFPIQVEAEILKLPFNDQRYPAPPLADRCDVGVLDPGRPLQSLQLSGNLGATQSSLDDCCFVGNIKVYEENKFTS